MLSDLFLVNNLDPMRSMEINGKNSCYFVIIWIVFM